MPVLIEVFPIPSMFTLTDTLVSFVARLMVLFMAEKKKLV